jgi:hypothetical protein
VGRGVAGGLRRSSHRATGGNTEKVWPKQWVKPSSSAVAATTERSPPGRSRAKQRQAARRAAALAVASPYRLPRPTPKLPAMNDQIGNPPDPQLPSLDSL